MEVKPVTPETWDDFLAVMGPKGGDAGCFCMYYRQTSTEFDESKGDTNKALMKGIVESGLAPGLIGYRDGVPVGWVAVGPRDWYGKLGRSRVAKPLDERAAWSVTCFVIPKEYRGQGVATALLVKAVEFAQSQGATVIEGYPVEPRKGKMPDFWVWMGLASMFKDCGFVEVARRSETRPFMRKELGPLTE
jgi:GNAT superfamily N-acetyltransferase